MKAPVLRDLVRQVVQGSVPHPPVAQLVGFRVTHAEAGNATVEFQAGERHTNPMGTLHGGILCDIADAAMGMAYASSLSEGESFTTLELKINFIKPIWSARLHARANVVKQGRTIGLVTCEVVDENDQLVAHATCTQMTLRDDMARGR